MTACDVCDQIKYIESQSHGQLVDARHTVVRQQEQHKRAYMVYTVWFLGLATPKPRALAELKDLLEHLKRAMA